MADEAPKKVRYSKKQRAEFQRQRREWALAPDLAMPGTSSSGGSGGSAPSSYALASGADPTNPNSYLYAPTAPVPESWPEWAKPKEPARSDPSLADPLPTGKSLLTLPYNSPEFKARQERAQSGLNDPAAFVDENVAELSRDQTLIDKGMGFLEGLFNYEDESDLQLFGINMSAVESIWDLGMRHMTGAYNLKDIGIGALISAAPGGVQTMTFDELSGGHSLGEVLHGDIGLLDNVAPSPMQIAIASVAIESKRIREGGARLSDVLLLSPATAPFLLAGIAADTSPLQKEGFNLLDPEQRKEAFSSGYEQWMSGLGDFGVQMADPSIAATWGVKALSLGALGTRTGRWKALVSEKFLTDGYDELATKAAGEGMEAETFAVRQAQAMASASSWRTRRTARRMDLDEASQRYNVPIDPDGADEFWDAMEKRGSLYGVEKEAAKAAYLRGRKADIDTPDDARDALPPQVQAEIKAAREMDMNFDRWHYQKVTETARELGEVPPRDYTKAPEWTRSSDELGLRSPGARLVNDIAQVDEKGNPVMTAGAIEARLEFRRTPYSGRIAGMLHKMKDPYIITLALQALEGSNNARKLLSDLRPAIADDLYHIWSSIAADKANMDPSQLARAHASLSEAKAAMERQRRVLEDDAHAARTLSEQVGEPDIKTHNVVTDPLLDQRVANLDQSIDEIDALLRQLNGTPIDPAAVGDFYVPNHSQRIIDDLWRNQDDVTMALDKEIQDVLFTADRDARMITKDNWYARAVGKHRERSAKARYSYAMEGSGLIPKRVLVEIDNSVAGNPARFHRKMEWGWMAGSDYGVSRGRRLMRVWRWAGQETPAGIVGLKGTAITGSENELMATLDLDLYHGAPVMVKMPGSDIPIPVGGAAARETLMNIWREALADPALDLKTAIVRIERAIEHDMARAYGIPTDTMRTHMAKADRYRSAYLDQVRDKGYWVNPDDGSINYVPYLQTQLANSHYMHNWHHLEHEFQRRLLNTFGPKAGGVSRKVANAAETSGAMMIKIDEAFQTVWRPAVLFRMSYTQRNVFEGLTRSMAYYASVAPLLWPVKATYHGIDNKVREKIAARVSTKFVKEVADDPLYKTRMADLAEATEEHSLIAGATPPWIPTKDQWQEMFDKEGISLFAPDMELPDVPMRYVYNNNRIVRVLTPEEWTQEMNSAVEKLYGARHAMEGAESALDKAAGDGRFGKWRKKNIRGLRDELCQANARLDVLTAAVQGSPAALAHMQSGAEYQSLSRSISVSQRAMDTLRYDPTGAIQLWRGMAGRQKRIGSGTSKGPDGGTYMDAFADEYEAMNRGALSSDTARKMTLSSASDRFTNLFRSLFAVDGVVVPWDPTNPTEWVNAMARTIETQAWNPLVKVLADHDLDPDAAVEWMLRTPEGQEHALMMRFIAGNDFKTQALTRADSPKGEEASGMTVYGRETYKTYLARDTEKEPWVTTETRLNDMAERLRDPVTGQYEMIDHMEAVISYANRVAAAMRGNLQASPQFIKLQADRAAAVASGSPTVITTRDIENVLLTMSEEQRSRLGAVIGSETIQSGHRGLVEAWRKMVDKMFQVIGTIPEDAVVRGPFYNKRFKQVRNDLIMLWWQQNGGIPKGVKAGRFGKGGKVFEDDMTHPEFKIPADELQRIMKASHRQALFDTREYLYTIERRTNLGKYGEYVWPFISAQQNTITAGGKILFRNPWVAPVMYDLWAAPQRLGYKDEEGNLQMVMPLEWVKDLFEDAADIPVLGGVLSGTDMITIPMNGLNVWSPDTGFGGIVPRPSALIQMGASNLMQIGLFPVDTPSQFTTFFGEEKGKEYYQLIKDYFFGEEGSMSTRGGSWDIALPPYMRRILDSKNEMSDAYAYQYQLEWAAQGARAIQGEREWPTAAEINKRVTNKMWFYAFGNFGVPTPLTPYPILTRPDVQKPMIQELQTILQTYLAAQGKKNPDGTYMIEPGEAYTAFERDFGQDLLPLAMSGTSINVGGAQPTEATIADIKAYDSVIRDVAPLLGTDLGILDILVNNSNGAALDYSDEAYRYEKIAAIPGVSETWRQTMTGSESTVKRERDAGWTEFQKFMDGAEAKMYAAGVKNWSVKAAEPFRQAKEVFLSQMSASNMAWYADYNDGAAQRIPKIIRLLERMVSDPTVQERMLNKNQETLYGAMQEYVYLRQQTVQALEQAGDDDMLKDTIREAWDTVRLGLKQRDVRWAEIASRWLDKDENPQFAGEGLVAEPMGVAGG